jgi:hypothetical protein
MGYTPEWAWRRSAANTYLIYDGSTPLFEIFYDGTSTVISSGLTGKILKMTANPVAQNSVIQISPNGDITNTVSANNDFVIVTSGAGALKYGTYTAGLVVCTGTIAMKDSGGVTRNILVQS